MADLLTVPMKKPSEVDVINPLKNLIQSRYSTADHPEDYTEQIAEFSKLRNNAIWRAFEKYESSLEVIYSYYDQLVALETKLPPQEVQIPFKWKDAFDKGSIFGGRISLTISSLSYEKFCLLFNIAALQSAVAASQSIESDEGLKLAAKLLQLAAGIFSHMKSTIMFSIQQDPTPDLNPDTLGALTTLMLAQAQEIFVLKAIHDNMKEQIVAKLASKCEEYYGECLKVFQRENLKPLWDKEWIPTVAGKQAGYHALAQYFQSLVCKSKKNVGEEIARLEYTCMLFKAAETRWGKQSSFFQDYFSKTQRNLVEAKKDNDFIYHERIPEIKSVEQIGRASLAKMLPLSNPMSQNFKDLFSDLVPVVVHQAMVAYDLRKTEIQNTEIAKLRESTQFLNSVLASLNLPAAIEATDGENSLPPSILEKADGVRQLGGLEKIEGMIEELPELLKRNQDILNESERLLNEERDSDKSLREQFKEKWSRTPSEKLTEMFRSNAEKYRQIINNALQADKTIREKFASHRTTIELLSKPQYELQQAVPSGTGCTSDSSAVQTLRTLMEEVGALKAEREVMESELKCGTIDMKDKFLAALVNDGGINEPALSMENLQTSFGPLQKQVKDSVERQDALIEKIQRAHSAFSEESGAGAGGRESVLCQLAAAHDVFREILNNLQEGTKFYNDLTQLLVVFQNKISDYCFARKTEKEELMKDLTQESSRQAPLPTPSTPSYYTDNKTTQPSPQSPASGSSAPPQQAPLPGSLPYPVYSQGMPIPYGATSNTPYPSYVPPPMPQGYNPYGGVPYPGGYNTYPGNYSHAGYQPYQQVPPNAYAQQQQQQQPGGGYGQPPPGAYNQQPPHWQ